MRYFEERLIEGLVIGYAACPIGERLERVARFVSRIDNWALCDCFCWRLRAGEREAMWRFIEPYFHSEAEYDLRFAVVMALDNFVDEEHIDALLGLLGAIRHEGYYARMGVAWAVSVCLRQTARQNPSLVRKRLPARRLDLQPLAAENPRIVPGQQRRQGCPPAAEAPRKKERPEISESQNNRIFVPVTTIRRSCANW